MNIWLKFDWNQRLITRAVDTCYEMTHFQYSRSGLCKYRTDTVNEPLIGIRYCTRAAFWLDRNAFRTGLNGHILGSLQNSLIRWSMLFGWSYSVGKYIPFSSQPSTKDIRPPVSQLTSILLTVTSTSLSGSVTKYMPHTSITGAMLITSTNRPCWGVATIGAVRLKKNSPSSDVTCMQSVEAKQW